MENALSRKRQRQQLESIAPLKNTLQQCVVKDDLVAALVLYAASVPIPEALHGLFFNIILKLATVANVSIVLEHINVLRSILNEMQKESRYMTEANYSSMINVHARMGDLDMAWKLLRECLDKKIVPRSRTFSPLLRACAENLDMENLNNIAMNVYAEMCRCEVLPLEEDFVALMRVAVNMRNETNFHHIFKNFMMTIYVPHKSSWAVLMDWHCTATSKWEHAIGTVCEQGLCSVTGITLKAAHTEPVFQQKILHQIDTLVCTNDHRGRQWEAFKGWLSEAFEDGYDIIIDGANVGFSCKDNGRPGFDIKQIQAVVEHYRQRGKRVLVVLHEKRITSLSSSDRSIVDEWKKCRELYCCEVGNNDDWYWLYIALWSQRNACIVTNDLMRDHHFLMVADQAFAQWKLQHQIFFSNERIQEETVFTFKEPPVYARQIQSLPDCLHVPDAESDQWLCIYRK